MKLAHGALAAVYLFGLCRAAAISGVTTTEHFNQSEILDPNGNFLLFWNFNDTHVTFELHVKTKGWAGFGFSDNGNMFPADVVIGWVTDAGDVHFADRHTTEHAMPVKDAKQNWHLLYGAEDDFGTVLKFVRAKDTCDTQEDMPIQEGTSRLIYAYDDADPVSDDAILYHGTSRGTKSVALFSTFEVPEKLETDVITYDFLNDNYMLPNDTTTYWCKGFQFPPINKHHVIKLEAMISSGNEQKVHHMPLFRCRLRNPPQYHHGHTYEAVISPGNEMNVHHMLLYRCRLNNPPQYHHGEAGLCYAGRSNKFHCNDLFVGWAIGGQAYYFPDNVGMSVGDTDDPSYYVLETHYDNPHRRTGVLDNSGIRLTMTKTLRPVEGSVLWVGQRVNPFQVVPPYEEAYVSKGYCSQHCLHKGMTHGGIPEIKVFAAFQHSHLLGRAIRTRHFRNGTELEPIIVEPNYDFDFQQTVRLDNERVIKPEDNIQVDCVYNSKNRNRPTFGGLSTAEEMCVSFLYYYPRLKLANCFSTQTYAPFVPNMGDTYRLYTSGMDWDNATAVAQFKANVQNAYVDHYCWGDDLPVTEAEWKESFIEHEPAQPYVPPKAACSSG